MLKEKIILGQHIVLDIMLYWLRLHLRLSFPLVKCIVVLNFQRKSPKLQFFFQTKKQFPLLPYDTYLPGTGHHLVDDGPDMEAHW